MKNRFLLKPTKENGDSKKKAKKSFVGPKRLDALVILIYGSLSDDLFCTAFRIHKTNDVWKKVNAYYKYSTRDQLQVGWTIGTYTQTQFGFRSSSTNAKGVTVV